MDQYEHNPIRWWETSRATIGEVHSKLSLTDRSRIAAIGITHQHESFAPFDKEGRPLRNGILWLDGRATEQIRRYGSEHIHELSGKPAGVADPTRRSVTGHLASPASLSNPTCQNPMSSSFICG